MRLSLIPVALAALLASIGGLQAQSRVVTTTKYEVGRWTISAVTDATGFVGCSATAEQPRLGFGIVLRSGQWNLFLNEFDGDFGETKDSRLALRIGSFPSRSFAASSRGAVLAIVSPLPTAVLDEFRTEGDARFTFRDKHYDFSLAGVAPALHEVERCVSLRGEVSRSEAPPTPKARPSMRLQPATPAPGNPPATPPVNPPPYQVGDWKFQAFNDSRGRLDYCFALAPKDGDVRLGLKLYADGRAGLLLFKDGWKHGHDRRLSILYWLDRKPPHDEVGISYEDTGIDVRLSGGRRALDELAAGTVANFVINTESFSHRLAGAPGAVAELERCVTQYAGQSPQARPAAPSTSPAPTPGSSREYEIAGWLLQSYKDDQGRFESCSAIAPVLGPTVFGLQLDRDRSWILVLSRKDWKLGHEREVSVRYQVDRFGPNEELGVSFKETSIAMRLSRRQSVTEIAAGNNIEFGVGSDSFSQTLAGSSAAIAELERCVDRGTGTVRRPPPATAPQAAPRQAPQPQQQPQPQRTEAPAEPQLGEPGFRPSQLFRK